MTFFGPDLRNGLPIGLGSVAGFGIAPQFSPASLFLGGTVQGAWYDPSDSTTLFSDRAGTTPCGTPGGGSVVPVGLMLDKRVPVAQTGYYSGVFDGTGDYLGVASNSAFGYGTGDFTIEFWAFFTSISASTPNLIDQRAGVNVQIAPTLYLSAGTLTYYTNGNNRITGSLLSVNLWYHIALCRASGNTRLFVNGTQVGSTYSDSNSYINSPVRVFASNDSGAPVAQAGYCSNLRIVKGTALYTGNFTPPTGPLTAISGTSLLTCQNATFTDNSSNAFAIIASGDAKTGQFNPLGNHAIAANDTTARPELRAVVNLLNGSATLATQSVTTVATTYTLYFTGSGSITLSGTATGTYAAGSSSVVCTAGTLTLTVSGTVTTADLRPANSGAQLPVYQARTDANTYDAVGFPRYLAFNGTSSAMSTPANVNLSGTDKATVFAGVRKLSDAAQGVVAELSATIASNNGTFLLAAPNSAAANYNFSSKGTTQVNNTVTTFTAPITNVLTGQADIAAPSNVIRVNGAPTTVTSTQGTGNFGSYPLFIGSRNNASTFLTGNIYSLIVVGSAVSAGNITSTEQWVAGKTGITI